MKQLLGIMLSVMLLSIWGCGSTHKVEVAPVEVKPIHITIDVNVKVDRELDNFFSDIDDKAAKKPEVQNEK